MNILPVIILAAVIVALSFLLRGRRSPVKNQLEIVQGLNAEVKLDIRMAEVLIGHPSPRPFLTTMWRLHKKQLDFLNGPLQKNISDAFGLAEECNKEIIAARKKKSYGSLASLNVDKLKSLFAACQEGLEQWMLLKVGSRNPPVKGPSFLDMLIGKH